MDLFQAIETRRSCRNFLPDAVEKDDLMRILEAAAWAPSPLNTQPWEFVVITAANKKAEIRKSAEQCHEWAVEKSGWKWLGGYKMDFLTQAPVIVAVVGDASKTGVDMFQEEGSVAYQHACAAAVQNMLLAAHALDLAGLWFTFFHKDDLRKILSIPAEKTPLALICIGKAAGEIRPVPRKDVVKKTIFL